MELLDDKIIDSLLKLLGCSVIVGFGGWVGFEKRISALVFILAGLVPFIYFARGFWNLLVLRRDCYLGFLGERAVGEELNQLLANGWKVFHDVEFNENPSAKPFNVDHVVVGTGGIYAIETKTRRKRVDSQNTVTSDGNSLQFPWGREDFGIRNAQDRADHLSTWLSNVLQMPCPVTPVLALPGWSVNRTGNGNVRVISGKEISSLFRGEHTKPLIAPATAKAAAALLDQKCRDVGL